jgi:hypothetical protein
VDPTLADEPKTAQNISTWERWPIGGHEPSLTTLGLLAEIYECDLAHLVADLGRHQHLDQAVHPSSLVADRPRQPVPLPHPQHLERDHLRLEADLFDPMGLAGMATASDIGAGTIDVVQEAVELLCCAYAVTPARLLRDRSQQRLSWILELLGKRVSLSQHGELLVGRRMACGASRLCPLRPRRA